MREYSEIAPKFALESFNIHVYLFRFCSCFQPKEYSKYICNDKIQPVLLQNTDLLIVVGRPLEEVNCVSCL